MIPHDSELPPVSAPGEPAPVRASTSRSVVFVLVTLFTLFFIVQHFIVILRTIKLQGGNPLEQAPVAIASRAVLALQWSELRQHAAKMPKADDMVAQVFDSRLEVDPNNAMLRERYAVLLVALGKREEASRILTPLDNNQQEVPMVRAICNAFALRVPSFDNPFEDARELERLDGWLSRYALEALARRTGDVARADALESELQAQAKQTCLQLAAMVLLFAGNFLLGIAVVGIWLAKARKRNLRTLPGSFDDPPPDLRFDPLAGWCMFLVYVLVSSIVGLSVALILGESASTHGSPLLVVGVQLIVYALMVAIIGLMLRGRWAAIGLHRHGLLRSMLTGLCLFFGAAFVIVVVGILSSLVMQSQSAQNNPIFHIIEQAAASPWQMFALVALTAVLGPVFEEILFRGVIYTSMRRVMSPHIAIPLNGLLFSAIHGDLNTLLPLSVLGMLLAYGYERTGSLATSAVCHCLWNAQTMAFFLVLIS